MAYFFFQGFDRVPVPGCLKNADLRTVIWLIRYQYEYLFRNTRPIVRNKFTIRTITRQMAHTPNTTCNMDDEMSADNPPPMASRQSMEHVSALGKKDTKLINRSKGVVYLVLFLSAVIVSVATFFYMEQEDSVWYHHEVC